MNPFLYKAHPLLLHWADLLANPSAHGIGELAELALGFLLLNAWMALGLLWTAGRAAGIRLALAKAFLLAIPASLLYLPFMLTVVGDVIGHEFQLRERYILIFSIFVGSQMLSGFYAIALRHGPHGQPAGLATGMSVALVLFLVSIPACLALLGADALRRFT
jgi:hypothetical protein